jgi:hypothetical protein
MYTMLNFRSIKDETLVFAFDIACDYPTISRDGCIELVGDDHSRYFTTLRGALLFGLEMLNETKREYLLRMCEAYQNDCYVSWAIEERDRIDDMKEKVKMQLDSNYRGAIRSLKRDDTKDAARFMRSWVASEDRIKRLNVFKSLLDQSLIYLGVETRMCDECGGLGHTIGFEGPKKIQYDCESCK